MAQNDLLERHAHAEAQGARAQPADRARDELPDRRLRRFGQPGGRDVDGFLEEWPVERIRLVEERERFERAAIEQAFEGDLDARDEAFDQNAIGALAELAHIRSVENFCDVREGRDELRFGVGADDAAAGRQHQRLEHAGIGHAARDLRGSLAHGERGEGRRRHARLRQPLAHPELVARRAHRRDGIGAQPQRLGDGGADHGGDVVHGHHGVDGPPRGARPHHLDGGIGIREREREQGVGKLRGHHVGPVGRDHEIHAERPGGVHEVLGAIGRGGNQQQQPHGGAQCNTPSGAGSGAVYMEASWASRSTAGGWAPRVRGERYEERPPSEASYPEEDQRMRVGIMIEGQEGLTWERWLRLGQAAEDFGFESLCRSDHLTGLWGESKRPSLETWTSLTVLATRTWRIRFGPMVSPLTFYHPALLAKMAVALDTLSGGRVDLGLGAGWNEHEHRMFGVPMPPMKERLDRLECAARHIRALGAGQPITLDQAYYPLQKAENYPLPTHRRLRIVIGGRGEKRTLRIAAEFADEWNVTRVDWGASRASA